MKPNQQHFLFCLPPIDLVAVLRDTENVRKASVLFCTLFTLLLPPLVHVVDTDGDGLDDSVETNTGIYVSLTDTGTDSADADTDKDSIPDGLEVQLLPDRDPLVTDWMVISGGNHICALDDTGVVCWGMDGHGQSMVPALANPVAVSTGGYIVLPGFPGNGSGGESQC